MIVRGQGNLLEIGVIRVSAPMEPDSFADTVLPYQCVRAHQWRARAPPTITTVLCLYALRPEA